MPLLRALAAEQRRVNFLVTCGDAPTSVVVDRLRAFCPSPFRTVTLPGHLYLPPTPGGTLLLNDVSRLTLAQQIEVFDWLTLMRGGTQVAAISSTPLAALVQNGEFLEGLYYRLNMVTVNARMEYDG
jgi:transcriptional regulator of aromatic amino acid metabolism